MTVATQQAHETGLVAFVVRSKRDRILWLLQSEKGRQKLREQLPHFSDWDPGAMVAIPQPDQTPAKIADWLRAKGAPADVYLLSLESHLDGRQMPLAEALANVVGIAPGTVISCIPGKLGYFEGESPGDRHGLLRS